jgi:hypothetical protein
MNLKNHSMRGQFVDITSVKPGSLGLQYAPMDDPRRLRLVIVVAIEQARWLLNDCTNPVQNPIDAIIMSSREYEGAFEPVRQEIT